MKKIFFVLWAFTFLFSCSSSDNENCERPLNFTLLTADENFALFLYDDNKPFAISVIEYGKPGFELGVNAIGTNTYLTNSFDNGMGVKRHLLYGLEPNTDYEAYIKLQCAGGSYSKYSGPISFTTLEYGEGCTQPESLIAIDNTDTTILIDWEGFNNEQWEVLVLHTLENGVDEEVKYQATEIPFLIENLLPATTYYILVRASSCNEYEVSGMLSNKITVVTDN